MPLHDVPDEPADRLVFGLTATPDLPADLAAKLADELPDLLTRLGFGVITLYVALFFIAMAWLASSIAMIARRAGLRTGKR